MTPYALIPAAALTSSRDSATASRAIAADRGSEGQGRATKGSLPAFGEHQGCARGRTEGFVIAVSRCIADKTDVGGKGAKGWSCGEHFDGSVRRVDTVVTGQ